MESGHRHTYKQKFHHMQRLCGAHSGSPQLQLLKEWARLQNHCARNHITKPHCTVVHFLVRCHFFAKSPFRNMVSSTVACSVGNWISRTHQQVCFRLLRIYTASIGIKFNAWTMTSLAPPFSTSIELQHYFS